MQLTPADMMIYSTVRIDAVAQGQPIGSGTAFFVTLEEGGGEIILLITNKHVLAGAEAVSVLCHETAGVGENAGPSGTMVRVVLEIWDEIVINHPSPEVDLCAILFSGVVAQAGRDGTGLFMVGLLPELIPSPEEWAEFDAIEEVTMVGCPSGLFDEVNGVPIARRGITATPLRNRYQGKDEFLIDIACFPGSSGSAVFLYEPASFDASGKVRQERRHLVGILYSGPVFTQRGEVILGRAPAVAVDGMMHLGQVIRSTALLNVLEIVVERARAARQNPSA
ncbi:MAG TPA: serine protease [Allosphingosinicella sp.]|jgi:hypothetical protein